MPRDNGELIVGKVRGDVGQYIQAVLFRLVGRRDCNHRGGHRAFFDRGIARRRSAYGQNIVIVGILEPVGEQDFLQQHRGPGFEVDHAHGGPFEVLYLFIFRAGDEVVERLGEIPRDDLHRRSLGNGSDQPFRVRGKHQVGRVGGQSLNCLGNRIGLKLADLEVLLFEIALLPRHPSGPVVPCCGENPKFDLVRRLQLGEAHAQYSDRSD